MRHREWLPGSGMLYFFSQRVSLTICLYIETCNMGGKPVTNGMSWRGVRVSEERLDASDPRSHLL